MSIWGWLLLLGSRRKKTPPVDPRALEAAMFDIVLGREPYARVKLPKPGEPALGRVKCRGCGIEFAEADGKCWKCGTPIPQ